MTTEAVNAICIWHDTMAGSEEAWIVSHDHLLLPNGEASFTRTLHVCESRDEALALAKRECTTRRLPLYENSERGPAKLLAAAAE